MPSSVYMPMLRSDENEGRKGKKGEADWTGLLHMKKAPYSKRSCSCSWRLESGDQKPLQRYAIPDRKAGSC